MHYPTVLSKDKEGELLNIYSLHSRKRKKKNPLQNCRHHCNTTNLGGRGKGESLEKKLRTRKKKKIKPT